MPSALMLDTVVPAGIPFPVTAMPTSRPAVVLTVTVVLPAIYVDPN